MKCAEVSNDLPDYVRGTISREAQAHIEEHLAGCDTCRVEEDALHALSIQIGKDTEWKPRPLYWSSILPRIHGRINRGSFAWRLEGVFRFVAPVAAAIIVIIGLFRFGVMPDIEGSTNAPTTLGQLTAEELQLYVEQQSVVGLTDHSDSSEKVTTNGDKTVLEEILRADSRIVASAMVDEDTVFDSLSDQDTDELLPLLERRVQSRD